MNSNSGTFISYKQFELFLFCTSNKIVNLKGEDKNIFTSCYNTNRVESVRLEHDISQTHKRILDLNLNNGEKIIFDNLSDPNAHYQSNFFDYIDDIYKYFLRSI